MAKAPVFLVALLLATSSLRAAPRSGASVGEATELQDRIDRRATEIASMIGYCARLERLLIVAGFPRDALAGGLSLQQKMDRILPAARCDQAPLIEALRDFSRAAGVELVVDWKSVARARVAPNTPVTFEIDCTSASAALLALLDSAGGGSGTLAYQIEDGEVKVVGYDPAALPTVSRSYDVAAVLPPNMAIAEAEDELRKLVMDTVSPDTWKDLGGTVGSLAFTGGAMTVIQTPANQRLVEHLLDELDVKKQNAHYRKMLEQQTAQIIALNDQAERLVARCRSVGVRVPPRLDATVDSAIQDLQFVGSPLAACFISLQQASGQEIHVKWEMLRSAGIDLHKPITLILRRQTLASALKALVRKASEGNAAIDYEVRDNAITVSTQADFDKASVVRVYDVRDLLEGKRNRQEEVEMVVYKLMRTIDPDSWRDAGGTIGSVRELQGQLIITHNLRVHAQIKAYLDALRHRRALGARR